MRDELPSIEFDTPFKFEGKVTSCRVLASRIERVHNVTNVLGHLSGFVASSILTFASALVVNLITNRSLLFILATVMLQTPVYFLLIQRHVQLTEICIPIFSKCTLALSYMLPIKSYKKTNEDASEENEEILTLTEDTLFLADEQESSITKFAHKAMRINSATLLLSLIAGLAAGTVFALAIASIASPAVNTSLVLVAVASVALLLRHTFLYLAKINKEGDPETNIVSAWVRRTSSLLTGYNFIFNNCVLDIDDAMPDITSNDTMTM